MVGSPVYVLGEQALGLCGVEVPARAGPRVAQNAVDPRPQLRPEPLADRDAEALLAPVDEMLGQSARGCELLEQPLRGAAPQLQVAGQSGRVLVDAMVEQRRADLDTSSARAIEMRSTFSMRSPGE